MVHGRAGRQESTAEREDLTLRLAAAALRPITGPRWLVSGAGASSLPGRVRRVCHVISARCRDRIRRREWSRARIGSIPDRLLRPTTIDSLKSPAGDPRPPSGPTSRLLDPSAPHPVDVQFISVVSSRDAAVIKEVILTASLVWLQLGSWLHRPRALEIGNADAAIADSLTLPPPCLSAPSSYYHQLLPNDLVGHARTDSSLLRRCARSVQNSLTARIPSSPPVQFFTWDPLPTDPGRSTQILRSLSPSPAYYHARSIYNLPPEAYLTLLEVCPRYPSGVPPFPNPRWSAQGP